MSVQYTNGKDVEPGRERVDSSTLHSDGEDGIGNGMSRLNGGKLEVSEERTAKVDIGFEDPGGDRYNPSTNFE